MPASSLAACHPGGQGWLVTTEEKLDRALVAGLMLQAVMEAPAGPIDPNLRRRYIKSRLTQSLVGQLSGRISIDRFRTLMHHLEHWFPFYYPLMPSPPPPAEHPGRPVKAVAFTAAGQSQPLLRLDLLKEWLANPAAQILPWRPQRKLHPEGLEDFFQLAQGTWFRVKDLAQYFDIDRKTAWEYLQKLQEAGLLVHNGARSAAVRYRLADHFLKIKLTALEQQAALALKDSPPPAVAKLAQGLAATAGDPFWEDHWPGQKSDARREEVISSLKTAGLLEVVYQSGHRRLLRLHRQWLKEPV